ncbi:glycoside hydrolase family 66 protein [Streptomyces sp. URMC 129]|uniref:glycoside hydrolase family 66 protein n=1 Tax=Streptomyces sp. URMC 129 TaxID=3423407 RepID=UPI003F1DB2BD
MPAARHQRPRRLGVVTVALAATGATVAGLAAPVSAAGTSSGGGAARVTDAWTDASRYDPGRPAEVTAEVEGTGPVRFTLTHLGDVVDTATVRADGSGQVTWTVTPPGDDFTGYLVEVDAAGGSAQTAIDVSSDWTRFPRMGFLAHYGEDISTAEAEEDIAELSQRYHINSLQYYDWLWKHELPVRHDADGGVAEQWTAWNGDVITARTVRDYIAAGDERGIAAMPYQMSYAALNDYDTSRVSPDWRLFKGNGEEWTYPMVPGQVLKLMNPADPGWQDYIVEQYADSVASMGFDGAHLDQIGYWEEVYDVHGERADRPAGWAELIRRTKERLGEDLAVGLNAVDGFGSSALAASEADYLYTELWANTETYGTVADYLRRQREESGGRSHITPAYMNRPDTGGAVNDNEVFDTTSVQLANAMFAANGAHHLEMGPNDHMLYTEYFLFDDKTMAPGLRDWQKTYYDVITAYENLFYGPGLTGAENRVEIAGYPTSRDGRANTLWTNVMSNDGVDVIHLINLLRNDDRWRDAETRDTPSLRNVPVTYYLRDGQDAPAGIHVASPDRDGGRSAELPFRTGSDDRGRYVEFVVPELDAWDFVYFDTTPDATGPGRYERPDTPSLVVTSPADDSTAENRTITVEGRTDAAEVRVHTGDTTRTVRVRDGRFSVPVELDGLENTLDIQALSRDGTGAYTSRTVYAYGTSVGRLTDPEGDDHGPGGYVHPTNGAFTPGGLDITGFQVFRDGDSVRLVTRVDGDITNPWSGDGMSVQRVNILLRDGAGGDGTAPVPALPGTNTATEGPWDLAVVGDGRYQDQPLSLGVWDPALDRVSGAELDVVRATGEIVVTVPADTFAGLDLATAGYQVSMLSNAEPGEGIGLVRPVYSLEHWSERSNGEFRFGGGAGEHTPDLPSRDTDTRDPNTLDVITGDRAQAEVLDWTGGSPVVLPFLPLQGAASAGG